MGKPPGGGWSLSFIRPMEPELVEQPPQRGAWSHEIKFDGYRTQIVKDAGGIRLFTKNGFDWTAKYKPLAAEAAGLRAESFVLDGETIVTNGAGVSDFQRSARPSPIGRRTCIWSVSICFISTGTIFATWR
ncbi:hypothetical protein [Mesorhizobium sp. WSM3224]|uniref:ATP-dependent DNA ligase n=1 Tax=Mesorhizobium sp. WSM3224 TaxID=1040986 RepID=UPI0032AF9529